MMNSRQYFLIGFVVFALVLGSLLVLPLANPATVSALPPRSTPTPGGDGNRDQVLDGAYIEMQWPNPPDGAWAVVEWQDASGDWHPVEGWQGVLGPGGYQHWYVASGDFDTGPFRWLVTQGQGGKQVAASEPFNLPGAMQQTLRVALTAAPSPAPPGNVKPVPPSR